MGDFRYLCGVKTELPPKFIEMLRSLGDDFAGPLLAALTAPPQVSVRDNALKGCAPAADADVVPWCAQGRYLAERPLFAADPAWHQGLYYVQEASSMIYTEAVRRIVGKYFDESPLRYLDACAAPGGKTISALEALRSDDFVVANELDRHRANILYENIAKYGASNVAVVRGDASRFGRLEEAFDIVAVDAPCSGEGMMRKEPEAVAQWSEGLVASCAATQRAILSDLWQSLRPGGVLIYSTCTFNRSENEENIAFLADEFDAESVDLGLDCFEGVLKGIDTPHHCYRFTPGHIRGEGIFIAAVRKPGNGSHAQYKEKKFAACGEFVKSHIADADRFIEVEAGGRIEIRPRIHAAFIDKLASTVTLLRGGLPVAEPKGRDLAPLHELALSADLRPDSFAAFDLDLDAALRFLRGESLSDLPDGLPKGFVTPCYGARPLGFAKNIGRRANNLIPDHMRLRMGR